ncbi:hypothetical protein SLV14_000028 [Streptomyces sp. Je 1-4]|uniref:hypothetical protein n=1 Tax=Streptomyces TaxID=1883 RepID=UPI0021D8F488|nr:MULTISPECIES: hypothetical protein [unclassified Streptomyces]UYB37770.1 hypothetical protein SLV14_000028 [Streptomyces sp. Je 1-4]UZQ33679.1 hypothetical protein SLV14N_000028 [Streptomyces sp. Je 1-4] [Streptomyces sp. Je 1-4 4N24]UZQ41097.1 hypothetical protein SLV14NA_000028 [Streptomyces sp. Je 1-4] [Streptomyces sp. Je 1-4 4N24_ara]
MKTGGQLVAADGQPGYARPVPAVNACGGMLTLGTCSWRSAACRIDHQVVIDDYGLAHYEVQAREEDFFKRFHLHGNVIPWRNDLAGPPFERLKSGGDVQGASDRLGRRSPLLRISALDPARGQL